MRIVRWMMTLLIVFSVLFSVAGAQAPEPQRGGRGGGGGRGAAPEGQRGAAPEAQRGGAPGDARGGRGGRGGGGGGIAIMTLVTTAWPDGGMIPLRYTQAGAELSPAIQWSNVPGPVTNQQTKIGRAHV